MATRKAQISMAKPIVKTTSIHIVGTNPLIVKQYHICRHDGILDYRSHPVSQNPVKDFMESIYWLTPMPGEFTEAAFKDALAAGAKFGFPANGLKRAAVSAAYRAGKVKDKISLYGAFIIGGEELIEIQGAPPVMREDEAICSNRAPEKLYRAEFPEWAMEFEVRYNADAISPEQIQEYFALGGAEVGLGEWRPEKAGTFGTFKIA